MSIWKKGLIVIWACLVISLAVYFITLTPKDSFISETLFTSYKIRVPMYLQKKYEGEWQTPESDRDVLRLTIKLEPKGNKSLYEYMEELVKDEQTFQNKTLVRKDSLNFNGFKGIHSCYSKNNSTGIIPVMAYFEYAVLQDSENMIEISSIWTGPYSDDVTESIKSIQRISFDSTKQSSPQKINDPKSSSQLTLAKAKREGFQVFQKENFMIKCNCTLETNTDFIASAKEHGNTQPTSAYICKDSSFKDGVVYNAVVYDKSSDFMNIQEAKYKKIYEDYLDTYADNLRNNNIEFSRRKFNGVLSIEYSFLQDGIHFRAIIFLRDKKSYLLQVAANNQLTTKFSRYINSFQFIE